jgi:hypothetical protein
MGHFVCVCMNTSALHSTVPTALGFWLSVGTWPTLGYNMIIEKEKINESTFQQEQEGLRYEAKQNQKNITQ